MQTGFLLGLISLLGLALPTRAEEAVASVAGVELAVRATNDLGVRLLRESSPARNALLSPLALQLGLAPLYAGTDGFTREEMRQALRYPKDEAALHRAFFQLRGQLDAAGAENAFNQSRLLCASNLFFQQGFVPHLDWLTLVGRHYGTTPQHVDFRGDPVATARLLNDWVSRATEGRLKTLVPPGGLPHDTKLALLNALFFRGKWQVIFQTIAPLPFRRPQADPALVPMMGRKASYPYRKFATFSAVKLPFRADFDLLILLPDTVEGLAAFEDALSADLLEQCRDLPDVQVDLSMPSFRIESPILRLKRPMAALGLKSVFDEPTESADLTRLAPRKENEYLALFEIWHRAEIQVDRFGVEGSAGNTVPPGTKRSPLPAPPTPTPPPPIVLVVDHPFLFAVIHRPTAACLFLGRMQQLDASNAVRPVIGPTPTPTPVRDATSPGGGDEIRELIMDFDEPDPDLEPD